MLKCQITRHTSKIDDLGMVPFLVVIGNAGCILLINLSQLYIFKFYQGRKNCLTSLAELWHSLGLDSEVVLNVVEETY